MISKHVAMKIRYDRLVVYLPADEAAEFKQRLEAEARQRGVTKSEVLREAFWKLVRRVRK